MKYLLIIILLFSSNLEAKDYTFVYNEPSKLKITITKMSSIEEAYSKAAKLCFKTLTGGIYQGDSKSLDIIDICANPLKY